MPNGGVFGSGTGLQLQATTPGMEDAGNFHISGTGITHGLIADAPKTRTPSGEGAGQNTFIGSPWTFTGAFSILGSVLIGGSNEVRNIQSATTVGSIVAIGFGIVVSGSGHVCLGANAQAGNQVQFSSASFCVAIGATSQAWTDDADSPPVAIGGGAAAKNAVNTVVIGQNCQLGTGLQGAGNKADGNIWIAPAHTSSSVVLNSILIDARTNHGSVPMGDISNQIIIGNQFHTKILIASKDFTNLGGTATRTVADMADTVTAQDGTLIYTSITAARIVTLPAANAVPIGYRILVTDGSGSASGTNTITLTRLGSDTINGGTTATIILPFGCKELISDGVSKWTVIRSI
jgi:hypothetical protein